MEIYDDTFTFTYLPIMQR